MIRTGQPGAIKASYVITDQAGGQCRTALNSLGSTLKVILLSVAGYEDIDGNRRIDGQTRQGSDIVAQSVFSW